MKTRFKVISLSAFIVLLGFLREYLFGNINWVFLSLTKGRINQARDEFQFFFEWSPTEIIRLKWMLTCLFFILFCTLTTLIIRIEFVNKTYTKATILLFAGLLLISGLFYTIGALFSVQAELYPIIRTLMGIGQSFMPLMILFVLFKFFPQNKID